MKLYDVYYLGSALDSSVPLPGVDKDIKYAINTNWSREKLTVKKDGKGHLYWYCEKHSKPYLQCSC